MTVSDLKQKMDLLRPDSVLHVENGKIFVRVHHGAKILQSSPDGTDLGHGIGSQWICIEVPDEEN